VSPSRGALAENLDLSKSRCSDRWWGRKVAGLGMLNTTLKFIFLEATWWCEEIFGNECFMGNWGVPTDCKVELAKVRR
jgi:hypothetical protein